MRFEDIDVISPALFANEQWNEAEVFGAITWLWLECDNLKEASLLEMASRVLPMIKSRQFALFSREKQPIGYISWAYLDELSEAKYVDAESWIYSQTDWNCGNRMWLINWFAAARQSSRLKHIIENYLFPDKCFRALHHKGDMTGLRVNHFKGKLLSKQQMHQWWVEHPILATEI